MIETSEYFKMLDRMLRAAALRSSAGDDIELRLMFDLVKKTENYLASAVRGQITQGGKSWADIGRTCGITKQAAHQRWSK